MTAHTGTHMDAGRHFLRRGSVIDEFPLEVGIGRARVMDCAEAAMIGRAELEPKGMVAISSLQAARLVAALVEQQIQKPLLKRSICSVPVGTVGSRQPSMLLSGQVIAVATR